MLTDVGRWADFVIFGNNAGQAVPLAQHVPHDVVADKAAIIYAQSLPELDIYQRLAYRTFYPLKDVVSYLLGRAEVVAQPLALCFVNTIQHNDLNYQTP